MQYSDIHNHKIQTYMRDIKMSTNHLMAWQIECQMYMFMYQLIYLNMFGFRGVEERGYWGGQDLKLITLDQHECFSVFHHLQKDKQRKRRRSLKLGKKRRESSKRNYYIISPRVIIKAIIISIFSCTHLSLSVYLIKCLHGDQAVVMCILFVHFRHFLYNCWRIARKTWRVLKRELERIELEILYLNL